MKLIVFLFGLLSSFFNHSCYAAENGSSMHSVPGNVVQIVVSLLVIVGVLIGLALVFKKFGLNRLYAHFPLKIIGTMSLGSNQRIVVVEANDEWIVLGVTPQHISTITRMPRQETPVSVNPINPNNMPKWLKKVLINEQ